MCKFSSLQISFSSLTVRVVGSLPDLTAETGQEWGGLLRVLTEFCGCSLDQSLSRELMEAGDEEHLARVSLFSPPPYRDARTE